MKILTGLTLLCAISALAVVGVVAMRMESLSQDILTLQSNLTVDVEEVETRLKSLHSQSDKANQKTHDELKNDTELAILEVNQLLTRITTEEEATSTITSQLGTVSTRLSDQFSTINANTSKFNDYDISFNNIYGDVWASVFCLEVTTRWASDLGKCHGTGWLAADGLIVTAQHVTPNPGMTVTVHQSNSPPFTATVKQVDVQSDVALLEYDTATTRNAYNVMISNVQLHPLAKPLKMKVVQGNFRGSSLMALGYSGGYSIHDDGTAGAATANVGVLSGLVTSISYGLELVMDVPIDPGDSGGPVFDAQGFVVGVNKSVERGYLGTFYAANIEEVYEAFPQLK